MSDLNCPFFCVPLGYIAGRSPFTNRHLRMPRALRSCPAVAVFFRSFLNISWSSPWGKIVDQSATHNGCFPLCMRELCVAIVTRWYTGQPDTRLPCPPASWVVCPKFHPLLQRSSAVYWFRPNPKGAGTARLQVLTCRLIDPNTRFWSRMHSHGQLGRPCFQKKTPSPEREGEKDNIRGPAATW